MAPAFLQPGRNQPSFRYCPCLSIATCTTTPAQPLYDAGVGILCGVAIGRTSLMDLGDVDLPVGTISIRETKFFKSRILPLTERV